ncbi:Uncharacterised protein [uncultured archaeon]|nr:Uncharacterised protein [uncultured archaeon]
MKILHVKNTANIASILAKEQRKLGHTSDVFVYNRVFNHPADFNLNISQHESRLSKFSKFINSFVDNKLYDYDLYHFHFGSFFPHNLDLPFFKLLGKKIVLHYHGDDIRGRKETFFARHLCHTKFVATPDLLKYVPGAVWIPNPVDLEELPYVGCKRNRDKVKIVHAPSSRAKKGTEHIINACDQLKKEGYKIELCLIENTPHKEAIDLYKQGDIVVDQLLLGVGCGVFGFECMALGKPVCVYVNEEYLQYFKSMPFVNTPPSNIKESLRMLIEDASLRAKLGKMGRRYIESKHNPASVAREVLKFY